jgi:putative phosphoribosyl transferase
MDGFRDRRDAGSRLAGLLRTFAADHPIVLGLARGGIPVAHEVARALQAPLDVWVVRKVGVPWHPELGIGAVAEGGFSYINPDVLQGVGLTRDQIEGIVQVKQREVEERVSSFRSGRPPPLLRDRTVILVDDGIATGGTVRAAIRSIRAQGPRAIVLAVPVAAPDTLAELAAEVDRIVCLAKPDHLGAIGFWYADFTQVSDDDVLRVLEDAQRELERAAPVVVVAEAR